MKLVQLARPLFLVALGLHALVLFLPTGSESEAVGVEDVDFSDSDLSEFPSKNPSKGEFSDQSLDRLPVADPNALAAASQKVPKPATLSSAAIATRPVPPRALAAARRPNPSTNRSTSGVPNLPASNAEPSASNSSNTQTDASTADAPQPSPPTSNIPDLTNRSGDQSDTAANQQTSTADTQALPSLETLIAKLTRSRSDLSSLLAEVNDISKALAYREEDTDDSSANQNQVDWKADIQRQANIGTVESIAPTEISDLTEMSYPIDAPKQADMKARSLSLCLEKAPHNAEVGVLFDSQGNVANQPVLIRSTGYDAINDEIIATVLGYDDFPPNRSSKAYLLEFEIDYNPETCVSLEDLKK